MFQAMVICFFRCLAVFKGFKNQYCETKAKELFSQYITNFDVGTFNGVTVDDLIVIEDFFKINVTIYTLKKKIGSTELQEQRFI